ncbi:LacI family DNA-binding transcriptional regulator [Alteromonas gilva]|uniref:LacI family DNA-binding transcriptional regulator n=1 Tax=Alteromonas gilva TaxID=2987522 RepID=A0ABT5L2X8_9ALTE|nr:LacI family DNA-binding transcriptional regulator [Alteromonas gilva]MDC8830197.1 LacI family DNA-binding transcriptional regulator [Alteromonas gilva]
MATIRDVSKESGLSIATVSRAISNPEMVSEESLRKVNLAIEKLQYRPNLSSQKFRLQRTNTIVVLVPNIANLFFAQLISGVEDVAIRKGYNVLLGDTRDNVSREEEFISLVDTRQADGLIQLRPNSPTKMLPSANIKAVNAAGCSGTPSYSVRIDNIEASSKIVKYLLDQGHQRIGVISGLGDNPHSVDRLQGYKNALAAAGIGYDEELVIEGDFTFWSGYNAVRHFVAMPNRPTALFCMSDEMAIGAIKGLKESALSVPGDMSVTGFDDLAVSNYSDPPLTTVRQPATQIGEKAAELLFQLIEGEAPKLKEYILPFELIIRESTRPYSC